eukprot:6204672-Lingulodinium_polyedra.AAC.1
MAAWPYHGNIMATTWQNYGNNMATSRQRRGNSTAIAYMATPRQSLFPTGGVPKVCQATLSNEPVYPLRFGRGPPSGQLTCKFRVLCL